jgi:hypothetical protein
MMAYDGPGGALFKNNRKERDSHPDLQGNIELSEEAVQSVLDQMKSGVKYPKLDLSGWTKVSGKGNKFISLSAKKPWEKSGGGRNDRRDDDRGGYSRDDRRDNDRGRDQRRDSGFDLDDEIPF